MTWSVVIFILRFHDLKYRSWSSIVAAFPFVRPAYAYLHLSERTLPGPQKLTTHRKLTKKRSSYHN